MDEHQTTLQSNSSSDAASDDLSNSLLGKMKCSVSKMLPNSISKWLSPKVDAQNNRRRRHDELDSEEEETEQNRSTAFGNISTPLVSRNNNYAQGAASTVTAAPPNKRQRIFTPSPFNTYAVPRRDSIISSTLIEDTTSTQHRLQENGSELTRRSLDRIDANNQFRASPLAAATATSETRRSNNDLNFAPLRSQPMASRADRDLDETSSNRSANRFTLHNDSMAVNFSAHLQKSKSLFSNKSYVSHSSRSLSNYRMRHQSNSSLYRSTSSLCDNNSNASSNASSALSSPFYNGQTTFGGASAQSKRFASAFHSQQHRAKVPSRLVPSNLSKSTSSLNVTDSTAMSPMTTAKRILDILNQSSTPLGDVRRVSNALPTTATTSAFNKRLSVLMEEPRESESDKMKRKLLKPNTPYNRPVGRSVTEPCFTQGLNVPSMPQLLQLKKKLTNNTIKSRELASQSNSILNKPLDNYKLPERATSTDLDATNNNHKSSTSANHKHVNKIRNNNISKQRKAGKLDEHEMPPTPVDLPNVQLKLNSAEIKLPTTSFPAPKAPIVDSRKISDAIDRSKIVDASTVTFKFTPLPATTTKANDKLFSSPFASAKAATGNIFAPSVSTLTSKPSNADDNEVISVDTPSASESSQDSSSSSTSSVEIIDDAAPAVVSTSGSSFKFSAPIHVNRPAKGAETDSFKVQEKQNYNFSEPILINRSAKSTSTAMPSSVSISKPPATTSTEPKKMEFGFTMAAPKTVMTESTGKQDESFKALVAKQTQNKWSCSSCMTPNGNSATKCVCCGVGRTSTAPTRSTSISSSSGATAIVDDVFKSIAAKQKQSKWKCDSCMADNDVAQTKCLCCGENKPGGSIAQPATSFSSTTKPDDLFKSIAAKQKSSTWSCSVCDTKNDMSKSKCVCCLQAKDSGEAAAAKPKFSFGSGAIDLGAPSGKFSFGSKAFAEPAAGSKSSTSSQPIFGVAKPEDKTKSNATSFTFGNLKNDSTTTSSTSTITKHAVPLGTFAFGSAAPTVDSTSSSSSLSAPTSSAAPTLAVPVAATSTTDRATFNFGTPSAVTTITAQSTTTTTAAQSTTTVSAAAAAPVVDDIFKKIVSQQTAKWSCSSCMAQNNQSDRECACCNTPKDGSSASEKKVDSTVKSQFSFGTPSASTFSFGSKPVAMPSTSYQFGAPAQTTVTSSNTVTSTSSTFSFASSQPSFGSQFAVQKTVAESSTVSSTATTTASKPFQFGFGSTAPSFGAPKFGSPTTFSSDVTDTASSSAPNEKKSVNVLENVVIQPVTSVEPPKPTFLFGAPSSTEDKTKSISLKRHSTDVSTEPNLFKVPTMSTTAAAPSLSATPFVFGQPNSTTNPLGSSSSTLATNPQSTSAAASAPAFSFGTNNSSQLTSFSFNATPSSSTPAAPAFGSASFSSIAPAPATASNTAPSFSFGASNTAPAFGASNATPSFGNPIQNPASTEQAPAQSSLFQFGTSTNQSVAPATDAFRFNANATPSFNFTATNQPQADSNAPFQFSQGAPLNNLFAPQSSTVIKDRRKLRPVRRVNRP